MIVQASEVDGGRYDVVIVGAGHAGVQVASVLATTFGGSVALLSGESRLPYERPPLTKGLLNGELQAGDLLLRPESFWQDSSASLVLGQQVVGVDAAAHAVVTASGAQISYGSLVWAAGAHPLQIALPGLGLPGVHELRTLDDTLGLRAEINVDAKVVIVGGGFVGLEAASAAVKLGANVTVLESRPRLLERATGADISHRILQGHRDEGVDVQLDAVVTAITEREGRARGVLLADGREIAADVVLVSVGVRPNTGVLSEAGAVCSNGIEIDLQGRTSLPDVYAAGDCTCFPMDGHGVTRLESLQNAVEQGEVVAHAIAGQVPSYDVVPYFWSNQHDMLLKTVGLSTGHDEAIVRDGGESGRYSVVYLRQGRVCAVDSINAMKDYVDARTVLGAGVDVGLLRDPDVRLRDAVIGAGVGVDAS